MSAKIVIFLDPNTSAMVQFGVGERVVSPEGLKAALESDRFAERITSHRPGTDLHLSGLDGLVRPRFGRRNTDLSRYHMAAYEGGVEAFLRPSCAFDTGEVSMSVLSPESYLQSVPPDQLQTLQQTLTEQRITHVITRIICDGRIPDDLALPPFHPSKQSFEVHLRQLARIRSLVADIRD